MLNKVENNNIQITIYTDGSCVGNPGKGGWGAILLYKDASGKVYKKKIGGMEEYTTNNRMELMAVIESLKILKKTCDVEVYSDSKYVIDGITKWMPNWIKKNWRNSGKSPVKNQELWKNLNELLKKHKVNFNWVKGHADNDLNNEVDQLAKSYCC